MSTQLNQAGILSVESPIRGVDSDKIIGAAQWDKSRNRVKLTEESRVRYIKKKKALQRKINREKQQQRAKEERMGELEQKKNQFFGVRKSKKVRDFIRDIEDQQANL